MQRIRTRHTLNRLLAPLAWCALGAATAQPQARIGDEGTFRGNRAEISVTLHETGGEVITAPGMVKVYRSGARIGQTPTSNGHASFILNTGDTDLVFLEVFRSNHFEDVSLSDWLAHTPHSLVAQHLNIDPSVVARFPANKPEIVLE